MYNKYRKQETTNVVAVKNKNNHSTRQSRMVIFYCLCSKIQIMINKATFMIAVPTNPKKSRYVISNKAVSTILTTSIIQSYNIKL